MCGISGIISKNAISRDAIEKMTDAIIHRGPDDYGYYHGPGVALGHRRLAILDLSKAGHQPMEYLDRYVITYNGEIYNYIEIRKKLESEGYAFQSHTDTEVIMAAYDKWGVYCVKQFNGMWAFAIYDKEKNLVFCSRDRFGVKPFYYWVAPDGAFYFGSEIKQFSFLSDWKAKVNPQRVYDYLVFGITNHTDETLFQDVYELPKGCSMCIAPDKVKVGDNGRLPATKWYEFVPEKFTGSFKDASVELKTILADSVRLRLRSDVPVGSCLSGGLDSSSIVCIMNKLLHEESASSLQKTFSACSEIEQFSEKKWIDEVVNEISVDAYYTYPSLKNLLENLSTITWHQDEPFDAPDIFAQWSVFHLASNNKVKVMLDGQGSDEILAGYSSFFPSRFAGLLKSKKFLDFWKEIRLTKKLHGISQVQSLMKTANILLPNNIRRPFLELVADHNPSPKWINMDVLKALPLNPYLSLGGHVTDIQAMSKIQLMFTHLPKLLHWEDRDSMAHSIEARCPFLDYRLVEFVLGLPDEYKLSNGLTKRVLRNGMSGVLPNSIRDRMDKKGFMTPDKVWMSGDDSGRFREKLNHAVKRSHGILNQGSSKILEDMISDKKPFTSLPWRLINFGEWMSVFNVSV